MNQTPCALSFVVPVLPGGLPAVRQRAVGRGSVSNDSLEEGIHRVRDVRAQLALAVMVGNGQFLPVPVQDTRDRVRLAIDAACGEGRIRRGHRQRGDFVRTEGEAIDLSQRPMLADLEVVLFRLLLYLWNL